jgi:phosphoserine phosphatase
MKSSSLFLITVSGQDRPGITHTIATQLAQANIKLVDMGQSVIFGFLSLTVLVEVTKNQSTDFLKNVLFECKNLSLNADFKILDEESNPIVQDASTFFITCVSDKGISALFIQELTGFLAKEKFNINNINHSTNDGHLQVLEIGIATKSAHVLEAHKKNILLLSKIHGVDLAITNNDIFRYNKRLIVFDMDSTLIEQEVIDELAKYHGVYEKVCAITHAAMSGELDFETSLRKRVKLLKGLSVDVIPKIQEGLTLTKGTMQCIETMQSLGIVTAVISGGFTQFTSYIQTKLGLDHHYGNTLEISDGHLTGELLGDIIDKAKKAELLESLAKKLNINLKQSIAVGDGANDLLMLEKAGMGIAFNAKDIVKEKSSFQLSNGPMTSILLMMGIPLSLMDKRSTKK